MAVNVEKVITDKAEETRKTFRALLDKTNKEHPSPNDELTLCVAPICLADGVYVERYNFQVMNFHNILRALGVDRRIYLAQP